MPPEDRLRMITSALPSQAADVVAFVVLDTNIVLDLFLFQDPRTAALRDQLRSDQLKWIATQHMRNELERVLTYTHIATKLAFYEKSSENILTAFDQYAHLVDPPQNKSPYTCKDADDQVFIDLACHLASSASKNQDGDDLTAAHTSQDTNRAVQLISKDKAVLAMRKRLEKLSVFVKATHLV